MQNFATIRPIDHCTFNVTWTPQVEGTMLDSLKIYHQFKNFINPVCIPVRGKASASTGIHDHKTSDRFTLGQNYPNPFNPSTQINYSLKEDAFTSLTISDIQGRVIKTLVNDFKKAGHYETRLESTNMPSGVYFYQLQAGNLSDRKKMMLIK